jgi:demethylmenaquinone methyltransferase/2-methoxy-6-polyprenyl-1,4-benzoquinol methylase
MNQSSDALSIAPTEAVALRGDEKRDVVRTMFDRIAPNYDLLNLIISLGQTTWWRKRALKGLDMQAGQKILDVGCGTGWVLQFLRRKYPGLAGEGMDLSPQMLVEARRIDPDGNYFEGDVCALERPDNTYDLVVTVFTSRNFPDLEKSVQEMMRVLKPGGRLLILDSFPAPAGSFWGKLQRLWMRRIVPILVRPFADPKAYNYLAESIENHVASSHLAALCGDNGARKVRVDDYSFGSATRVLAIKEGDA